MINQYRMTCHIETNKALKFVLPQNKLLQGI